MNTGGGQSPTGDTLLPLLTKNYTAAQGLAAAPFVPYTGQMTPAQPAALGQAVTAAQGVSAYKPQQVSAPNAKATLGNASLGQAAMGQAANSGVYGMPQNPVLMGPAAPPGAGTPSLGEMAMGARPPVTPPAPGAAIAPGPLGNRGDYAPGAAGRDARRADRDVRRDERRNGVSPAPVMPGARPPGAPPGTGGPALPPGSGGQGPGGVGTPGAPGVPGAPLPPAVAAMQGLQGMNAYMNPYIDSVVNAGLSDLDRSRQMAQVGNSQNATQANAWGGSRHGIAESETNRGYGELAGQLSAGLRNQGFNTASGLLMGDKANLLQNQQFNAGLQQQTNLANQGASNAFGMANMGAQNQFGLANMGAQNQFGLANQQMGMQSQLANQQAGLQGAQTNLAGAGQLGQLGAQQYGMDQNAMTQAYNEWLRMQSAPYVGQDVLNKSLGMFGTMNGQYTPPQNAFAGIAGGLAQGVGTGLMMSDAGLKTDIETAGYDAKGRRWVDFRYIWDEPGTTRHGVIAQEVQKTDPDAVSLDPASGFLMVDYSKLN